MSTAAGAAGAVQLLASPVVELAGPVVQSAGRFDRPSARDQHLLLTAPPTPSCRRCAGRAGNRVHLDLDPLLPFPRWHEYSAVVEEPIRRIPGVAEAHIEGSLGRLVVELEDDVDNAAVLAEVRSTVAALADDLASTKSNPPHHSRRRSPTPAIRWRCWCHSPPRRWTSSPWSAAVTGWVAPATREHRKQPGPRLLSSITNPGWWRSLEARLGRVGTDIALAATHRGSQRADPEVRHTAARSDATHPANLRGHRAPSRLARP